MKNKPKKDNLHPGWMAATPDQKAEAAVTRFPTPMSKTPLEMTPEQKIVYITEKFRDIMLALGLDLTDDSLQRTPERIAKMYVEEIFSGLNPNLFPEVSFFEDRFQHNNRINDFQFGSP